jgi:serine/threonine protein kinase
MPAPPETSTSQETKESPTRSSKEVLRSASIAYARKTVDATFKGSVLVRDETIPRFSPEELQLGKFLGKGAFGTVSEIKAFDALSRRNKRRQLKKVATPQAEESEVTETDRVQRESRLFISQNCCRLRTGDARYAVKKLRADVTKDPGLFLQAITDMAVETRILTNLQHPNIIKLRAVASCDCYSEDYFLVLDRLYDTLAQRIQKWAALQGRGKGLLGKLSDRKGTKAAVLYEERVHAAYDLAAALDYMHLHNIVYRDIKVRLQLGCWQVHCSIRICLLTLFVFSHRRKTLALIL